MPVVRVSDVVAAIDLFLTGQLDAAGLEAWAEQREMAEDMELADANREAVAEALFLLANPTINGALSPNRVWQVRARLLGNSPEPG